MDRACTPHHHKAADFALAQLDWIGKQSMRKEGTSRLETALSFATLNSVIS
jgi:hypothetical protein